MKRLVGTIRLLRRNWKALIGFELLYKLAITTVFVPLLVAVFSLTINASGIEYLSTNTLKAYLLNPVTVLCLLVILLAAAFISLLDIQAVISCCRDSYFDRRTTISKMALDGLDSAKKVLLPKNWLVILFVLLLVPLTNTAAVSGFISRIEIPEFIADYINANMLLHALQIAASVALSLLSLRWCLSLHAFTLEKKSFFAACRESAHLTKKRLISIAFGTIVVGFLLEVLLILFGCALVALLFVGIYYLCPAHLQYTVASYVLFAAVTGGSYLSVALSVPFSFAYLSVRYFECQSEAADITREAPVHSKKSIRIVCGVLIAAILCGSGLQILFSKDMQDALQLPEIAAHRGSSVYAPENSMPAFQQAIWDGADWIELDVHQTKDGVVVVTHDESIKRIAGVEKNVWQLTYDELVQYDVGSWFSPEYADLRIATLDEVLKLCKGKIKLNIELKPTGHEPDFEKHVLELIHKNGYEEGEYILASLNADTLKTIKQLEPEVKTLYIMTIAAGKVKNIDFADAYSIEESSITSSLVASVHAAGKQLNAWTVNRADNVEKMAELGVDCIISDDPVMARAALTTASLSDDLMFVVDLVFKQDEVAPVETETAIEAA